MEGNHTSRTGVLSGVKNSGGQILDVRSWQGLTEVLKRARESGMNDEEYASFRDTVLEYAQSGGEETLRSKIESVVASFPPSETKKIEVTKESSDEAKQPEPAKPRSGFAGGRPTPHFTVKKEKEITTAPPKTPQHAKLKVQSSEPVVPAPHQKKDSVSTSRTLPVQSVPENLPTGTPEQTAKPMPSTPKEKPVPPPAPAPEPRIPETETPPPPLPPSHTLTESKARIAAIKHEVNAKIGNPGTLIDNGNAIGRDYMSALLSAMKASAGGSAEDLDVAMARLEKSYELVMQFADKIQKKRPAPPPPAPKPAPEPPPQPEPEKPVEQSVQEKPVPTVTEADVTSFEEKKKESFANIKKIVAATKLTGDEETSKQQEVIKKETPQKNGSPDEVPVTSPMQRAAEPDRELPGEKESAPVYHRAPSPQIGSIPSLADRLKGLVPEVTDAVESGYSDQPASSNTFVKPVQGTTPSQTSSEVEGNAIPQAPETPHVNPAALNKNTPSVPDLTSEPQRVREFRDDLFSEKVTNALEQLLDEWDLFRKSGILGIGPSGIHHPLYTKLKDLTMFSVTSGRFEGSTPDIRQSLMDYVNAWRYEQGVAFSPTESFEHYLRRVIVRILKRRGS